MAALVLSAVTGWFLFLPPTFSFTLGEREAWTLILFSAIGAINVALVSGLIGGLLIHAERQRFLIRELHHRSQNLFAVIQTIASRSLVEGQTISGAKDMLTGRLAALARVHSTLANGSWEGAPLKQLVVQELAPFEKQISVTSCETVVNTPTAQTFGLILHELATNAAKYGALCGPEGRVAIECRIEGANGQNQFHFSWRELGGPPVAQPTRKGFGSAMLFDAAKRSGHTVQARYEPEGLIYELQSHLNTIEAARTAATSPPETTKQAVSA